MIDAQELKEAIEKDYYMPVSAPFRETELQEAANAFLDYLRLPREVKREMHYKTGRERETPDGYNEKTLEESKDPKEFFHWTPRVKDIPDYDQKCNTIPEVRAFGDIAEKLYETIEAYTSDFFDEVFPEYKHHIFDTNNKLPNSILRFLSYRPKPDNNFCAKPHYDKGFATFALAESAPGLRIGCCNDHELRTVKHEPGTMIFMPAWKLYEVSEKKILPAWHDVVHNVEEQNVNDICARWAIVFFMNSPTLDFGPRGTIHTPLH